MQFHPLSPPDQPSAAIVPRYSILLSISLAHFFNDSIQALLVPIYPMLKDEFRLSFTQIGFLTLTYQITASLLQPLIGRYTDRHPQPYSLSAGMACTLLGLLMLAAAPTFSWLIIGACVLGMGSSVFHPESSRVARMAAGGRFGLAQSIFQVGGNAGNAFGPLLAALIVVPHGLISLSWFAPLPIVGTVLLLWVGGWAKRQERAAGSSHEPPPPPLVSRKVLIYTFIVLLLLIFSKYLYIASITSYFIFYLTHRFGVTVQHGQILLFVFLFAMAAGTMLGGPVGDRIGRKYVIWISILGITPFTLALPYAGLAATGVLVFIIGLVLASAFSAIVVYAQELVPGRVGTVAGLFFGLSFGIGGIGAGVLGWLADTHGIEFVYSVCSYLPLLGIIAIFLPKVPHTGPRAASPKTDAEPQSAVR